MDQVATWFEQHDKLAGWAQFFGSILALLLTYFTAFAPGWRRKRQLHGEAKRLLMHGYEVVESFHRTSAHFAPFPLSLKQASLSMTGLIDDIGRFPIYELDENFGRLSMARRLTAMRLNVSAVRLFLDELAADLGDRTANDEEHETLREMVGERLKFAEALLVGREMTRPEWPAEEGASTRPGAGG